MKYLQLGNLVSIIAGFLILALLLQLSILGLNYAFQLNLLLQMWAIWILGIFAFIFYNKSDLKNKAFMSVFAPLALSLTLIGLILTSLNNFLGLGVILLGYLFEPIAGYSIYKTVQEFRLPSNLFYQGAIVYTLGLPLLLFDIPEVSIVGDIIKIIGLILLRYELVKYEEKGKVI